ncbi:MKI67 FHA domain-interacting nucleolar phosphoprotein-like [Parasteatoda tepidariorum]|uniref:MKI67 FHA domain-interacting nucleolar phosphoprotein n=1 Tax=Parasteatoda tepidariorum TaxID=114398 RepID=UPI00077FBB47|nr:MKI67 FHA domain-interacting nucleolar phosphoprotein [Parasteatoda tepidariorum]XP_042906460.1 MKI67 FHA domain-interacting nucleolar phosphoprotein-like [Parasteatoda tepidariorum]
MMNSFVENVRRKIKPQKPVNEAKREKRLRKKQAKLAQQTDCGPGTIYIGHIPHGFYETEMKQYFSQFGEVTNLRLAKSRRSLRSKGYAFIQFKSADVAKVVAETMNNYLFFERLLKCEYVPEDKLHPDVFKGWKGKRTSRDLNRDVQNRHRSEESIAKSKLNRKDRLKKLKSYLKDNNITFKINSFKNKE